MNTIAIIQARMGSTRFPGKVMKDLGGEPVLHWVISALWSVKGVDKTVIATSTLPGDDIIEEACKQIGARCFRGSESDVLDRFYQCALKYEAHIVLRITCDCPFLDPFVIDQVIQLRAMTGAAYCTNQPTWPDGLDVECFTVAALEAAWKEATRPTDRDCVTQFIIRNADRFPQEHLICPFPGAHKERWVLDTEKDYEFCKAVVEKMKGFRPHCTDLLRLLDEHPELRKINAGAIRNERFYEGLAGEPVGPRLYTRSNTLLDEARKVIPGGSQTYSKSYVHFPAGAAPLYVTHGDGGRVFDVDGNDYVDLVGALLPVVLGYRDPDVDHTVRRQLSMGMSFSLATKLEIDLADKLIEIIPCAEMVKFGKSGTDVTTAAIRLARAYTKRDKILVQGGYHGWGDWSATMTNGIPKDIQNLTYRYKFGDYPPWPLNDFAAVIVEPNENRDYLQWLRQLCTAVGTILIFDEIKTGFRYDIGGAQKLFGVTPDLACFGKAMGNGMPISALVGRKEIMKKMEPEHGLFYSGTFFGDTLSIAAALATIDKLEKHNVIKHLYEASHELEGSISFAGIPISLTGRHPLKRIRFEDFLDIPAKKLRSLYIQEMAANRVLTLGEHGMMYAHKAPELKRIAQAYKSTLDVMCDCILTPGEIDKRLKGMIEVMPLRAAQ